MRRITCLFIAILSFVSCNEDYLQETLESENHEGVVHERLTFKEFSIKMSNNPVIFTKEFKSIVIENYELSSSHIIKNLSETD